MTRLRFGDYVELDDGRTGRVTFVTNVTAEIRFVPDGASTQQWEWVPIAQCRKRLRT
jgi:hypothetical protein